MRKIYLIRHGKAEKEPGTYIGITDCPLAEEGRKQMQKDGKWLKNTKVKWIASSDLTRAIRSAEALSEASGIPYVLKTEAFREINLGRWEGNKACRSSETGILPVLAGRADREKRHLIHADVFAPI